MPIDVEKLHKALTEARERRRQQPKPKRVYVPAPPKDSEAHKRFMKFLEEISGHA